MPIQTIAVIGAGPVGRSFALAAVTAEYSVILEDVLPERLREAQSEILQRLEEKIPRAAAGEKQQALTRLRTAASVDLACREADLVMDTTPEEMEMKIDIFCILEKFARPRAILATNVAKLSISEIAAVTTRAAQCVGLRFIAPGESAARLEIVRGRDTSDETAAACRGLGQRMGLEVREVREPQV